MTNWLRRWSAALLAGLTLAACGGGDEKTTVFDVIKADPSSQVLAEAVTAAGLESALRADGSGPTREQVVFTFDLTTAEGLFAARSFRINPKDTVLVTEASLVSTRNVLGLVGTMLGLANTVTSN